MSKQKAPTTDKSVKADNLTQDGKVRKSGRDRHKVELTADMFIVGQKVWAVARERNGYTCRLRCEVADVYYFEPAKNWVYPFTMIVRVQWVEYPRYQPLIGRLIPLEVGHLWGWGNHYSLIP